MTHRDTFLNTIKQNLQHAFVPEATPEHPGSFQGYSFNPNAPADEPALQFKQELEALAGHVHLLADIEETVQKILEILQRHQTTQLIAWSDPDLGLPGLHAALTEAGVTVTPGALPADGAGRKSQLAAIDDIKVGLTGAHGGLADTGAVALISGPGRGRLTSLLPPVHIALLPKSKLYPSLPAFLAANPTATELGSNLVFIAGPSRSGDIELTLSMGVHGPGEVHVIVMP
jgi:L-lactate dehydrogenase complex protein LldG